VVHVGERCGWRLQGVGDELSPAQAYSASRRWTSRPENFSTVIGGPASAGRVLRSRRRCPVGAVPVTLTKIPPAQTI